MAGVIGNDLMSGGPGNDSCIDGFDGVHGNDIVIGGSGIDHFTADPGDAHVSAEVHLVNCINE